ncbi:DMT family transporter [Thermodesulfobacteriota bacterium]
MTVRKHQLGMDLLLLLATFFWGITFIIVKQAVSQVDVYTFLAVRFGLAFFVMLFLFRKRIIPSNTRSLRAGVLLGFFLFAAFAFQTWGLSMTTAINSGFFTGLNVVMVPLFSLILLKRPPAPFAAIGVLFASAGLFILTGGGPSHWNHGDLLVFVCAVWVALHILLTGYFAPQEDPLVLAAWQIGTVAGLSLIFSFVYGTPTLFFPLPVWVAVGITAIFCTVFAFSAQTYAQQFTPPTRTALIFTAEPVFGALFSHYYGGEQLLGQHMLGGGLIFSGMVLSEIRPGQWKRLNGEQISP